MPDCNFLQMDATSLGFAESTFASVVCVEAAFYFRSREAFLREVHRVLKPGGWLVLTDTLVTEEAARRRIGRTTANQLEDPPAYRTALASAGFGKVSVVDATKQCWKGLYWWTVRFIHAKLLAREIKRAELQRFMEPTYQRVPDLTYYLLAAAQRG